ncbi:MAG: inositol 2-dehydrogenase, partial [Thermoprotei archaeon]
MIRVCEKAGVVLMVGFMKRFNPGFQKIKKLLDEGTLGKPPLWKYTGRSSV